MRLDLFSEETLCGSILVNDHLKTEWSLTGGSTG